LAAVFLLCPGPADAGIAVKTGLYKGSTTQQAVSSTFRKIEFTVKNGKVILTIEPTVARESCVSSPVFTLGGDTATKKLGKDRAFTFTHTFQGTKVDKIPRAVRESGRGRGIRDLSLLWPGSLLRRPEQGQLQREAQVGTASR
jgi:hypothetical protein